MKSRSFKDYWEGNKYITYREYLNKYGRVTKLEKIILDDPNNEWEWNSISKNNKISLNFIREFYMLVNWDIVSVRNDINEEFIIEFEKKVNFKKINTKKLSIEFIRRYRHFLNWDILSTHISEKYYYEFQSYINWDIISEKDIDEDFVGKYQKFLNWDIISEKDILPESFLLKFIHKLNLNKIHTKVLFTLLVYKININRIQSWYKRIIINRKLNNVVSNVMTLSKKNILYKNINKIRKYSIKKYSLLIVLIHILLVSAIIDYINYGVSTF